MFNKSEIMRRAWAIVKQGSEWQKYRLTRLRYAMQAAWSEARRAARAATQTAADSIREAIFCLECKDRWSQADYRRHESLTADLRRVSA